MTEQELRQAVETIIAIETWAAFQDVLDDEVWNAADLMSKSQKDFDHWKSCLEKSEEYRAAIDTLQRWVSEQTAPAIDADVLRMSRSDE